MVHRGLQRAIAGWVSIPGRLYSQRRARVSGPGAAGNVADPAVALPTGGGTCNAAISAGGCLSLNRWRFFVCRIQKPRPATHARHHHADTQAGTRRNRIRKPDHHHHITTLQTSPVVTVRECFTAAAGSGTRDSTTATANTDRRMRALAADPIWGNPQIQSHLLTVHG